MKILYLEDHEFFAGEILERLKYDLKHDVTYANSWESVRNILEKGETFDASILDVILQNGKTGVQVAQHWEPQLGRIIFLTGCNDDATLKAIESYSYISKLTLVWSYLDYFLEGGNPKV